MLSTVALLLALAATSCNAVIVQLYSDTGCQNEAGQRNVYDNTCAPTGGFSSFKILTLGSDGGYSGGGYPLAQVVSAYSLNSCTVPTTNCAGAAPSNADDDWTTHCYQTTNNNGASNALSSSPTCGTV